MLRNGSPFGSCGYKLANAEIIRIRVVHLIDCTEGGSITWEPPVHHLALPIYVVVNTYLDWAV